MGLNQFQYSSKTSAMTRKYIVPQRVVLAEGANEPEQLLRDTPGQATMGKAEVCTLKEGAYLVLDFGCELHGGIEVTVNRIRETNRDKADFSGRLRIVFGESVSESLSRVGDENNAQNAHSVRDMTVGTCKWSTTRYGNTGFRFVKIEAVDGCIELGAVRGVLEYKDIPYLGSFQCNDQRLNRIFDTAVYTVHLNMQEYIWDGIKRDRLVWVGDLHPEVSTICSVFGYDESVEKSLDFARDGYPIEQGNEKPWMVFPSYTCWWIIIHRDWYLQNGRLEYLLEQKDYMYKACRSLLERIDEDGNFDFDGEYFVDWSSADTPWMEAGFRGCLVLGLEAAAEIFRVYGDEKMAEECRIKSANVKKIVPDFSGNKQVSAMAALSGLCDGKEAEAIITQDLLQGISTFYGYYVLKALAKAGNIQAALDVMRGYWGAMLDCGATTFWEDFDIDWIANASGIDEVTEDGKVDLHGTYGKFCYQKLRLSMCHGWASGPADFMAKHILGVQILEPGCRKVRIAPALGDLTWVKGTYPTPFGVMEIEHRKEDGKIISNITPPEGVEVVEC